MTSEKAIQILTHAKWHCQFGSNSDWTDREPEQADMDAAELLHEILRVQFAA